MKNLILPISLIALTAACASDRQPVVQQDGMGNYITSSEYEAMERTEFMQSMRDGLDDFDQQVESLRSRANDLGGESLSEFADCHETLSEKRREFENQLGIAKNALAENWPDERQETVDAYYGLRESLEEAYEEVLDT